VGASAAWIENRETGMGGGAVPTRWSGGGSNGSLHKNISLFGKPFQIKGSKSDVLQWLKTFGNITVCQTETYRSLQYIKCSWGQTINTNAGHQYQKALAGAMLKMFPGAAALEVAGETLQMFPGAAALEVADVTLKSETLAKKTSAFIDRFSKEKHSGAYHCTFSLDQSLSHMGSNILYPSEVLLSVVYSDIKNNRTFSEKLQKGIDKAENIKGKMEERYGS
jgi:hypothetical protein